MTELMEAPAVVTPGSMVLECLQHEAFAQDVAILGEPYAVAYKRHCARPDTSEESIWQTGSRLAADIKVASRIRFLKNEVAGAVNGSLGFTAEYLIRQLHKILSDDESGAVAKVNAIKALAELGGHNAPQKVESTMKVGPSTDFRDMLRTPACIAATVRALASTPEGLRAMQEACANAGAIEA